MILPRKIFPLLLPVSLGLVLIVCGFLADSGTGGSDVRPAPTPGQQAILHVQNHGYSLRFGDPFNLEVKQRVSRPLSLGEQPAPLPCRFAVEISDENGANRRRVFRELDYAGEYPAGRTIFFRSPLFDVPAGQSITKIDNLGCAGRIDWQGAVVSIVPVGEHLLGPILAMLIRSLGYIMLIASVIAAVLAFSRDHMKRRRAGSKS